MGCGAAKPIIKRCIQNQSEDSMQSLRTASRLFYKAKVSNRKDLRTIYEVSESKEISAIVLLN